MFYFKHAGGPGRGLFPEEATGIVMQNRTSGAIVKGQVVMVDELNASGTATSYVPGADLSALSGVHEPDAQSMNVGTFMVYEGPHDLAVSAWGKFTLMAQDVEIKIAGAVTSDPTSDTMIPVAAQPDLAVATPGAGTTATKVLAYAVEAVAHSDGGLVRCRFNGFGFGSNTTV